MRILVVHNYYQQPGGEDRVVDSECSLLRSHGHDVTLYTASNRDFFALSLWQKCIGFRGDTGWSAEHYVAIRRIIDEKKPDVVHVHNVFFMIASAAYDACRDAGVPVVHTHHNFRFSCLNGLFFRDGCPCERCLDRGTFSGVLYRCFQRSFLKSMLVKRMMDSLRYGGSISSISAHIALSAFSKEKLIAMGIPAEKIFVKPNFVADEGVGSQEGRDEYALFIGRLSEEKGIRFLIKNWSAVGDRKLKIVGDGPLRPWIEAFVKRTAVRTIELLGVQDAVSCRALMRGARLVVVPSRWYESFPRVIVEAFSCATPVLASRIGSLPEIVSDGEVGLLFDPQDPVDFVEKVERLFSDTAQCVQMGTAARERFLTHYSSERNYQYLLAIYAFCRRVG